jgi:hypothetical protein
MYLYHVVFYVNFIFAPKLFSFVGFVTDANILPVECIFFVNE